MEQKDCCVTCFVDYFLLGEQEKLLALPTPGASRPDVIASTLYAKYIDACKNENRHGLNQKRFGDYLTKRGFRRKVGRLCNFYLAEDLVRASELLRDRHLPEPEALLSVAAIERETEPSRLLRFAAGRLKWEQSHQLRMAKTAIDRALKLLDAG